MSRLDTGRLCLRTRFLSFVPTLAPIFIACATGTFTPKITAEHLTFRFITGAVRPASCRAGNSLRRRQIQVFSAQPAKVGPSGPGFAGCAKSAGAPCCSRRGYERRFDNSAWTVKKLLTQAERHEINMQYAITASASAKAKGAAAYRFDAQNSPQRIHAARYRVRVVPSGARSIRRLAHGATQGRHQGPCLEALGCRLMNWLNLRTETLRSPEFAACETAGLGTWLRVTAYCCEQENGGRLSGASKWNDRQWMLACGVSAAEVVAAHPLIYDDGIDVFCHAYPEEKQATVIAKREAGRIGGSARTEAKTQAAKLNGANGGRPNQRETQAEQPENPSTTQAETQVITQRNPREGERKENRNGKENPKGIEQPEDPPKKARKRSPASPDSRHHVTIERWMAYSEKRTGTKYPFTPRDAVAVKTLLAHFETPDAIGEFIRKLHQRTGFPFTGSTETLYDIANNLGRLQGALAMPPAASNGKPPRQTEAQRDEERTGRPPQEFNIKNL